MIRQMLKLIWKRKRSNGFLVAEILLTFIVLYGILVMGLDASSTYNQPDGFTIENVLNIKAQQSGAHTNSLERAPVLSRLALALSDIKEVDAVGLTGWDLYQANQTRGTYDIDKRKITINIAYLSDSCLDILNMDVIQGRWFSPEDDGSKYRPAVINATFANVLSGDESPVGKVLREKYVVVGVVSDFRLYGPLGYPLNLLIDRITTAPPRNSALLVKLNTQVNAKVNARILQTLQAVAPEWTFNITPAEDLRAARVRQQVTPYLTAVVAGVSLIGMVILGLLGVLWQNIAGRTREIGLRRAKGANIGHIFTQIIGEVLIVATAGILPGIIIVSQLLLMDTWGFIPISTHIFAMTLAAVGLYSMVVICSLYPCFMAIRINPAQALHYE